MSTDTGHQTPANQLRAKPTTAVYADVQNVYYTVKQAYSCHFNYSALWSELANNAIISAAHAYAIDRGDARQQQFQSILRSIGFQVKLKPFIQRSDGSAKGDWDVGITLDVIKFAAQVDQIVLISGDGDFDLLLHELHNKYNVKTVVYGVPSLTAESLIAASDEFRPIASHLLLANG